MSIPSYKDVTNVTPPPEQKENFDSVDVVDAMRITQNNTQIEYTNIMPLLSSPISTIESKVGCTSTLELESNSEDSSLSDGDRTLVDSAPDIADLSSTNNSPACSDTQLSSPEYHTRRITDFDCDDDTDTQNMYKSRKYYFKASIFDDAAVASSNSMTNSTGEECNKPQKILKVLVDGGMILGTLKQKLEPFVKVPKEYFKIFRMSSLTETECTRLTEQLSAFK